MLLDDAALAQSVDRGTSVLGPAFAFIAACAFALGTVLQQKGTLGTTSGSGTGTG